VYTAASLARAWPCRLRYGRDESQVLHARRQRRATPCAKQFEPKNRFVGYFWPKSVELTDSGVIKVKSEDGNPIGSKMTGLSHVAGMERSEIRVSLCACLGCRCVQ